MPFEITPTRPLADGAFDLAIHVGCTAYDATCLALAIHHDCRLVTADSRLRELIGRRTLPRHISVLPAVK